MNGALREPTIDDLRVKLCWICREEETRSDVLTQADRSRKSWVHPCACTLVAHEDCLLAWIKESQSQPSRRDNALKCPQCNTQYSIESNNPFLLRVLDRFANLAARAGTYVSLGIVAGVGISFAGSIYALCVYYGAHAVRVFVGDQMYNFIIGDDPREWTWWTYWNLPLVPIYLLASRAGRVIDTALYSPITLPLLVSMSFPPSTTLAISNAPVDLPSFLLTYPPSPSLCLLAYPFVRAWYTLLRTRLTRWILQTSNNDQDGGRRQEWILGEEFGGEDGDANVNANLQINVDIVEDQVAAREPQNNADGNGNGDANQPAVVNARPRRVRVTLSSFGQFVTRALITPWIASYSGKLLERISQQWDFLRRVLAINNTASKQQLNWLQNLAAETPALRALNNNIGTSWHRQLQSMEPIWWRNTLGLSLWIVARDAVTIVHLFLRKRELQSRRIVSRSFQGIDVGTLDLISPAAF